MNYFDQARGWKCRSCALNYEKPISVQTHRGWYQRYVLVVTLCLTVQKNSETKGWDDDIEQIASFACFCTRPAEKGSCICAFCYTVSSFKSGSCQITVSYLRLGKSGASLGSGGASSGKPFDLQLRRKFKENKESDIF